MSDIPSVFLSNPQTQQLHSLNSLKEVFDKINNMTSNLAEIIFDHLINISDEDLYNGKIPNIEDKKNIYQLNGFIRILNDLFPLAYRDGLKVIKRETVEYLNKKTFAWAMCFDGGESLDILCEIVNEELNSRTPSHSPKVLNSLVMLNSLENSKHHENVSLKTIKNELKPASQKSHPINISATDLSNQNKKDNFKKI
jgi:hypothetical protein